MGVRDDVDGAAFTKAGLAARYRDSAAVPGAPLLRGVCRGVDQYSLPPVLIMRSFSMWDMSAL